jgi:type IV pilus assembly protein PilB
VITVEDPIEYAIENVQQTTARPDIGFTFADAIRSFLRLDPDVILVGEIRDHETALEAIRASQTGHLVFATLHCNDTTDAVQRLFDLGMNSNSISSELIGVLSQRLPRRICESCKIEARPDKDLLKLVFPDGPPKGFKSFAGKGCTRCRGYGTYGRIACVEFLTVDSKMRMAISRHPPLDELRQIAVQMGLQTMRDAALDLVSRELIALTELPIILSSERLGPEKTGSAPAARAE